MWTRPAIKTDFDQIRSIDPAIDDDDARHVLVLEAIELSCCWIAGRDASAEGFIVLLQKHFFGRDFVSLIIVEARARRSGLASALFDVAEQSSTTPMLFTSTNQSNAPMQSLLMNRGYEQAGVITHLDPGDPELVFVKNITEMEG